jgi:hypothetical protein
MAHFKLGRKALVTDSRTLRLARYFSPTLAPPPASVDWTKGVTQFGMMLNGPDPNNPPSASDGLGDCTIAGVAHAIQIFTANSGTEVTLPDQTILDYYEWWDGYVDGDPSTDNGGVEIDVLNHWRKKKFWGHRLDAYADPSVSNLTEVRQAVSLFGGLYIGLSVTDQVMQNDNDPTIPWDVTPGDTIDGGHCVFVTGYDAQFIYFISWGQIYKMTLAYWNAYVDESHALLSPDFLGANGLDPQGFNLKQLQADLAAIV